MKFQLIALLALVAAVHGTAEVDSASCPEDDSSDSCHLNLLQGKSSFIFARQAVTSLAVGNIVALRGGQHGKYCADEDGKVICNRNSIGPWERFIVEDAGSGKIALRGGRDGKLCADDNNQVICNRNAIGSWEKFSTQDVGNGKVALRGGRDGKLCADETDQVICNRNGLGAWEQFTVEVQECSDFGGDWIDEPHWYTPRTLSQTGCVGTSDPYTFTVNGNTVQMSSNFHGGLSGTLVLGAEKDTIQWSNGALWERYHGCDDFGGKWIDEPNWYTPVNMVQNGCAGGYDSYTMNVAGNTIKMSSNFHNGMTGTLQTGTDKDIINWASGATWERYHSCSDFGGSWIDEPNWYTPVVFTQQADCTGSGGDYTFSVSGNTIQMSSNFHNGLRGTLQQGSEKDIINWASGATWEKYHPQPVDCQWDAWGAWTECSKTCGSGTQNRDRAVLVEASNDGNPCVGESTESSACNTQACPVHCVWEDWTDFSECSVSCGGGKQSRTRIEAVNAANNGNQCQGEASENQDCNTNACPTTSAPNAAIYGDPHMLSFDAKDSVQ
jgi:hypothetical protein